MFSVCILVWPTPVFLPGESQEQGSLVGCCLWGCTEADTTEVTQQKMVLYSFFFVHAKLLQSCPTLCNLQPARLLCPWDSPRQEYWSGLPCPPPGDLPNPGIKPVSLTPPVLLGRFFTTSATWEAVIRTSNIMVSKSFDSYHFFR